MPIVEFERVSKQFGAVRAVDEVSFVIERGEFFSLLGPSGCGKTTTLRLLAGFEDADGGVIRVAGEPAAGKRPYERRLGMVFQSYALFPHLSVARNVAFGLERRRVPPVEIAGRVAGALELVRLDPAEYSARRPQELSGGQRQRVALARALVLEPEILLLDEPLGAIDLQLRRAMQLELKQLNRDLGVTFVYVTHDQDEALTMSDRIAVMDGGRLIQVGTPAEVYERPRTAFVAAFIGESNFVPVGSPAGAAGDPAPPSPGVQLAIRPERIRLEPPPAPPPGFEHREGRVEEVIYQGDMLRVLIALADGGRLVAALRNEGQLSRPLAWSRGAPVLACWRPEDATRLEGG